MLLAAVAVVFSHLVLVVGKLVPRFLQVAFKLTTEEVVSFMSFPTRFATGFSWVFVVALLLALSVSLLALRLYPRHVVRVVVVSVCMQAIVVWVAFFCYCYNGFYGLMSLHHEPEFDLIDFTIFGAGIFPASLAVVLIPLVAAFLRSDSTNAERP